MRRSKKNTELVSWKFMKKKPMYVFKRKSVLFFFNRIKKHYQMANRTTKINTNSFRDGRTQKIIAEEIAYIQFIIFVHQYFGH